MDEPNKNSKPTILEADDAINKINDALEEMDLDILSMEVSRITNIGPAVVVDCGGETDAKSNAHRDVYHDGMCIGTLKKDGSTDHADNRFWVQPLDEVNKSDLTNSMKKNGLVAIVDEEAGGIIGYALGEDHADKITGALQRANSQI